MNFSFEHIEYLPGLAVIPLLIVLFVFAWQRKKYIAKKIGESRLVNALTSNYSSANYLVKFIFIAVALSAIVIAAMNLQKPGQIANVKRSGIDVVIALDVSKSMLATDIKPSRLERARQLVYKLLDELKDDRIGLVFFAGRAYLQMPLTTDHSAARIYVQNASPDIVPTQGTIFSEALRMSNSAFNSKERKFKSIILISDGEDHDAEAEGLATTMAQNGIMINTVGIGSSEGSNIIDPATGNLKTDLNGQPVISRLNESLLQQLSTTTKGVYVRLDDVNEAVRKIKAQLDTIEKSPVNDPAFRDYISYYYWFIALALLLIVLEFVWPERKWKTA